MQLRVVQGSIERFIPCSSFWSWSRLNKNLRFVTRWNGQSPWVQLCSWLCPRCPECLQLTWRNTKDLNPNICWSVGPDALSPAKTNRPSRKVLKVGCSVTWALAETRPAPGPTMGSRTEAQSGSKAHAWLPSSRTVLQLMGQTQNRTWTARIRTSWWNLWEFLLPLGNNSSNCRLFLRCLAHSCTQGFSCPPCRIRTPLNLLRKTSLQSPLFFDFLKTQNNHHWTCSHYLPPSICLPTWPNALHKLVCCSGRSTAHLSGWGTKVIWPWALFHWRIQNRRPSFWITFGTLLRLNPYLRAWTYFCVCLGVIWSTRL